MKTYIFKITVLVPLILLVVLLFVYAKTTHLYNIAEDFVTNRQIAFNEFAIFPNYNVAIIEALNTKR